MERSLSHNFECIREKEMFAHFPFFLTMPLVFNLIYPQSKEIIQCLSGFSIASVTAFFLMTKEQKPDWALVLHTNPFIDTLLIISVVFHALYGLRTVAIDLGLRKEKLLFWVSTLLSLVLSALLLVLYFTRNY
jgi:succinate dehydrogenase hydrophobic anchor subunit